MLLNFWYQFITLSNFEQSRRNMSKNCTKVNFFESLEDLKTSILLLMMLMNDGV